MRQRFEYEIPITSQISPGDTVWFRLDGAAGVDDVKRAPCLEFGYKDNRSYCIETTHGFYLWSDGITKAVRPYSVGAWMNA